MICYHTCIGASRERNGVWKANLETNRDGRDNRDSRDGRDNLMHWKSRRPLKSLLPLPVVVQ